MTTFTVDSTAELNAALSKAKAGDTVSLDSGTYSGVAISNAHFSSAVTITSADPAHAAVFSDLKVTNSSGLKFSNLEMTTVGGADAYYGFRVANSQNITFDHLDVHGDTTKSPDNQISGFYVTNSSNVTIEYSEFSYFFSAVNVLSSDHVRVLQNAFTELNKGGIEVGGSSHLNLSDNNFTNFVSAAGVHSDAIQIFTQGFTTSARGIIVDGNLFYRGSGFPVQGVFMGDEVGDLPYRNVTIENNTLIGGMWDSIYLPDATGVVKIEGNTLASWNGQDAEAGGYTNFQAWIYLAKLDGATLTETGNAAQYYMMNDKAETPPAGNTTIGAITDNGVALFNAWVSAHHSELGTLSSTLQSMLTTQVAHTVVGIVHS